MHAFAITQVVAAISAGCRIMLEGPASGITAKSVPEYQAVVGLRLDVTDGPSVLCEGFVPPSA